MSSPNAGHRALPDPPGLRRGLRAADGARDLPLFFCFDVRRYARRWLTCDRRCLLAEELKDMAFECVLMDDPVVAADGLTYTGGCPPNLARQDEEAQ